MVRLWLAPCALLLAAVACILPASATGIAPANVSSSGTGVPGPDGVTYEFVRVVYDWSEEEEAQAIANGTFVVENCLITGVKVDARGTTYLTVPRWRPGVPSTLNKVVMRDGRPVLQPYPSWAMQKLGDYSALQYVQSMEIDTQGRMWILDAGRINFFAADPNTIVNGPPKLVIWDIASNKLDRLFVFPDSVASYDSSFLNDIVVDETNGFAYISDACGDGGIVIYSYNQNEAWRFVDPSMAPSDEHFEIAGVDYTLDTPEDGIALSPDVETLYYSALASKHLWSIPTKYLRDATYSDAERHNQLTLHGSKPSGSDGMTVAADGKVYYGAFHQIAVYVWDPTQPLSSQKVLKQDATTMQWVDTFAFDHHNNLVFTSNRLQRYFFRTMDYSGGEGSNIRVFSVNINSNSYLSAEPKPAPPATTKKYKVVAIVLAVFVVIQFFALAAVAWGYCRRSPHSSQGGSYQLAQ